ncbi:MAG: hypothetical protein ABI446_06790 [Gemmatimonadaceae bacterium]
MIGMMLLALACAGPCAGADARDSIRPTSRATAPDTAILWRYDLRTGDYLVYRETFRQEIDGSAVFGAPAPRDKPFGSPFLSAARDEWTSRERRAPHTRARGAHALAPRPCRAPVACAGNHVSRDGE